MKQVNPNRLYDIVLERILEIAEYQRLRCGKVENIGKTAQGNTDATQIHNALSYMDMMTQDYLMVPIYKEFPNLVPLVEETTGMKQSYLDIESDDVLIIDPVDGTKVYCDGETDYSIMVGLLQKGKMVVGIGCYPETKEVYAAIKGEGAWKISQNGHKEDLKNLNHNDPLNIAVHYRMLKEPYDRVSANLINKCYSLPTNKTDFGTNLSGILRIAKGESCAFIAPHITLHDFGVPALIIEEMGGVIRLFDYDGKNDTDSWRPTDDVFRGLDPKGSTPRYRVMIADSDKTVDRLLQDMYRE